MRILVNKRIVFFFATYLLVGCTAKGGSKPEASVASETSHYAAVTSMGRQAVASVNPIATHAGIKTFERGGNAIDAALAVAFTLGVVDGHNSGIGGGCFILARLATGEIIALDGREMAPGAAHRDMYLVNGQVDKSLSKTGPLAAGIPGSVAAFAELQRRGGNLDFSSVLLPAADIAERGFAVDRTFAKRLAGKVEDISRFPATAKILLNDKGQALSTGDILVQKDLASAYRKLAKHGADWFYQGEFANKTEQWMKANGGIITADDFANYKLVEREPVKTDYLGFSIYGFPPPSSGGVHVAQILGMLSHFQLNTIDEVERNHLIAEVMKRAFADRAHWLGDPDFAPVPKGLIDTDYLEKLAKSIDRAVAAPSIEHGVPPNSDTQLFDRHTTHIATADADGNWVAITTTLNTSFGSKVVVPGTGVILNNQMDDFSAKPGTGNAYRLVGAEANSIAPGKRPLSSMSPTIVTREGQPVVTLGAAGGPTIISQVVQTLIRYLALGQPIDEAVAGQRVHHQWMPNLLFIEPSFSEETRVGLQSKGHDLKVLGSFGGTQAIAQGETSLLPVTEPRVILRNESDESE